MKKKKYIPPKVGLLWDMATYAQADTCTDGTDVVGPCLRAADCPGGIRDAPCNMQGGGGR